MNDLSTAMTPPSAYCGVCEAIQPVLVEPMQSPDASGRYMGGDMVCTLCKNVIATLYTPEPSSAPGSRS